VSSACDGVGVGAGETLALVAIGANLGDRLATMRAAVERIARIDGVRVLAQSSVYDTPPVGPPDQPRYLNAGIALATTREPRALLAELLAVEATLGRERDGTRWTARTIDLDLILFGECVVAEGDLRAASAVGNRIRSPRSRYGGAVRIIASCLPRPLGCGSGGAARSERARLGARHRPGGGGLRWHTFTLGVPTPFRSHP
jgi:2-amino-4-hydroxy-6-hydroxymethyldihydropteridine diphosphokinase